MRKIIFAGIDEFDSPSEPSSSGRNSFRFSLFRPFWINIVPLVLTQSKIQCVTVQTVKEWALVLTARHLEYEIEKVETGYGLYVPRWLVKAAVEEIRTYRHENVVKDREDAESALPKAASNVQSVLGIWAVVTAFFIITGSPSHLGGYQINWHAAGLGDTGAIIHGAWYRAITPLFLHADIAHVLSNVATGAIFLCMLCRRTGVGLGYFLSLSAGIVGNVLKAILQGPGQHFIGASTAAFGMVGLLGGLFAVVTPGSLFTRRSLLPIGAALTLLAFLGSGGDEPAGIDLAGHVLGFTAGILFGVGEGLRQRWFGRLGGQADMIMGFTALIVTATAWTAAIWTMF